MSKARELASLGNAYSDGALSNRNKLINGDFSVWQRGVPITNSAGGSYFSADRWKGYSGSTRTFTQDTSSALSIGFPNCVKVETGAAVASFYNRIEDVRTLSGQTVTLSYYIKADAAHTPAGAYLAQSFGSGGSDTVLTYLSSPSVTTSWQRVVQTVTLPSVEGKTIGTSSYLEVYPITLSANQTYYITGVQLEVGDTATPFEHRSYGQELALCQRYYQKWGEVQAIGAGVFFQSNQVLAFMPFHKEMRAAPTFSFSGSNFCKVYKSGATIQSNEPAPFDIITTTSTRLNLGMASSGTSGQGAYVQTETGAYIKADAEL